NCVDLQLSHLAVLAVGVGDATSVAVGLGGVILRGTIRDCALVAEQGVTAPGAGAEYLLSADLRAVNNVLLCSRRGLSFDGLCLHYGALQLADNLLLGHGEAGIVATGGAFPAAASIEIAANILQGNGDGIVAGSDGLRVADNEITGSGSDAKGNGIVIDTGL